MPIRLALALSLLLVTGTTARAETVCGTFFYRDPSAVGGTQDRPIRGAYVEVWQKAPGWWAWGSNQWAYTDDNGRFAIQVPYYGPGTQTALRIYAMNRATSVRIKDLYAWTFYQQPGPPGTDVVRVTNGPSDVIDFQFTFTDPSAEMYYNVADVVLRGLEYAEARRDPRESDIPGSVAVYLYSSINTFTDAASHVIHLDDDVAMADVAILHEYGHFLANEISSFAPWGAPHSGCTTA